MKLYIALLFIITLAFVFAEEAKVIDLTPENFHAQLKQQPKTLVNFFATYCGHSQNLAPILEETAQELDGQHKIAQVNCALDVNDELCNQYSIEGFPTLLMINQEGLVELEYEDARHKENLVEFILKMNLPSVTVIESLDEYNKLTVSDLPVDEADVRVVLVRPDLSPISQKSLETFTLVANRLRTRANFYVYTDKSVTDRCKLSIYRSFNTPKVDYVVSNQQAEPDATKANEETHDDPVNTASVLLDDMDIMQFIHKYAIPLFGDIGPHNFQRYLERALPLVWVFSDPQDQPEALSKIITPVAEEFIDQVLFCRIDGVQWGEHAASFGLKTEPLPGIVIEDRFDRKNYVFPQDGSVTLTQEHLSQWVKKFVDSSLEAVVRSEEIPSEEEQKNSLSTIIVGKTFDQIVMDPTKDVFVSFYASWCGHCQQLHPIWDEIAAAYTHDKENLVIGKIEATLNDMSVDIDGFPTLLFYPANDKANPIRFNGERSIQSLMEFIHDNRTFGGKQTSKNAAAAAAAEATATEDNNVVDINDDDLDNVKRQNKDEL